MRSATRAASNVGRAIGYIFIFGGVVLIFTGGALGLSWFNGLWLAVIGWFLTNAASGSYHQMVLQDMLQGHTASEIMTRDCQLVPSEMSLERLVNEYIMAQGKRCFPVSIEGKVAGLISIHNVKAIPREYWSRTTVGDAMTPFDRLKWVRPEQDLASVMQILSEDDVNQVPVISDSSIVGMLSRDNLVNFIDLQGVLGGARRKG
jgi:CBS domain-containing protein